MIVSRKLLIGGISFVLSVISLTVLLLLPSQYRATSTILLDPRAAQVTDIQSLLSSQASPFDTTLIRSQVGVLESRDIALQVVEKLDLAKDPEFRPKPPSAIDGMRDRLHAVGNAAAAAFGAQPLWPAASLADATAGAASEDESTALRPVIDTYLRHLKIDNDGRSYLIDVAFVATRPALAAQVANLHARIYLDQRKSEKDAAIAQADTTISAPLHDLEERYRQSARALQAYRTANNISAEPDNDLLTQEMKEFNTQVAAAQGDLVEKQSRLAALQAFKTSATGRDNAQIAGTSPLLDRLREEEANLVAQQAQLATKYSDGHIAIQNIKAQIADIRRQRDLEIDRVSRELGTDVQVARSRQGSLRANLLQLQQHAAERDAPQSKLHELELQAQTDQAVFQAYLQRYKQVAVQQSLQTADGRVFAPAIPPLDPFFPKRMLFGLIALVASTLVGFGVALALGMIEPGFLYLHQLERITGLPGLNIVPEVPRSSLGRGSVADEVVRRPGSYFAEKMRFIRSAIDTTLGGRGDKLLLVTSSLPREGKTNFVVALGRSLALEGKRVLVLDTDLRNPSMTDILPLVPDQPGLVALLRRKTTLDAALRTDPRSALQYIPTERSVAMSRDMLTAGLTPELLATLRARFDHVIFDSPPVAAVADALVLTRYVDATIVIVRWRATNRAVVGAALRQLRASGTMIAGVVMTRVDTRRAGSTSPQDFDHYLSKVRRYYKAG